MRVNLLLIFMSPLCVIHAEDILQPYINITNLLTGLENLKSFEDRLKATENLVLELKQQNKGIVQGKTETGF